MAAYSYKKVLFDIPQHIIDDYESLAEVDYEGDPSYNGDGWDVTALYIDFLCEKIRNLEEGNASNA